MVEELGDLIVYYDAREARFLERLVRRMAYGDALVRRGWRLEYRQPEGFTHYLLYRDGVAVGIQYVRAVRWLPEVQRKLAGYLTIVGFTPRNTTLRIGGARTPLSAEHNRLPKLFRFEFEHREENEVELTWRDLYPLQIPRDKLVG